jgi:hypothetical protein
VRAGYPGFPMTTSGEIVDLSQIAHRICERLAIGEVREILPLHQGYENFNSRLRTSTGEFVLRQYLEQPMERITQEIRVLRWLTDSGYPAVAPVSDNEGETIIRVDPGGRPWVVFPFVDGEEPDSTPVTAAAVGNAVGRLHELPDPYWAGWNSESILSPATTMGIVENVRGAIPKFDMAERPSLLRLEYEHPNERRKDS